MSDGEPQAPEENNFREDTFRRLAKRVVHGEIGQFTYCLENDQIYYYENGYWQKLREIEFLSKIENGLLDPKKNKILTKFDVRMRKKVTENYKILDFKRLADFNKYSMLNLENYMFDPVGVNVVAHKPEYFSTIRIPYKYDQKARCELWLKTLNEIFEGDQMKVNILQEFFGQCLTRDIKQEKALLLLGESRSGKSTILNTLHHLVGGDNCSSVPLKYILNPVYTSMMIHKLINFDKDVSRKAQDFEEDFKKIVTGEEVTANDKYMTPFTFKPFCKMVMSANVFPKITDHSSALYNRLILIPCDRVFKPEEQNRDLREELLKELPGVLNWAVEGLQRLTKRGWFEEVHFMREAIEELENENNPVNEFFNEHVEVEKGYEIEKGEMYQKYVNWSDENKQYTLTAARFSTAFYKRFCKNTVKNGQASTGSGKRVWKNIRYVQFKSNTLKTEVHWQDTDSPAETDKTASPSTIAAGSKQGDINWEE
jgi:putative DNA primase/helicase